MVCLEGSIWSCPARLAVIRVVLGSSWNRRGLRRRNYPFSSKILAGYGARIEDKENRNNLVKYAFHSPGFFLSVLVLSSGISGGASHIGDRCAS